MICLDVTHTQLVLTIGRVSIAGGDREIVPLGLTKDNGPTGGRTAFCFSGRHEISRLAGEEPRKSGPVFTYVGTTDPRRCASTIRTKCGSPRRTSAEGTYS